jgi:fucose 4-O-acetylase-like acetyltransferase
MTTVNTTESLEGLLGRNSERIKAALIIVVAADHNDWFRLLAPNVFEPLTFHVLGFFFLAFTFGTKEWSLRFIADRVARYLVPYWWALSGATLAYFLIYRTHSSASDSFVAWGLAMLIGNAPFAKSASGLLMLWFLPSLFGLTCLLAAFDSSTLSRYKYGGLGIALAAHLTIPLLPRSEILWLPFGFAIALNIFFLGLVWRQLLNLRLPKMWGPIVTLVFVISYGALVSGQVHLEVATLELAGINSPKAMLFQDLSGIAGVLAVVWLVSIPKDVQWLEAIGKNSLMVYLLHPVAYVVIGKLLPSISGKVATQPQLLLYGCLTTCIALGSAYAFSVFVTRSAFLSAWVIPKTWTQWPPAARFLRKGD